MQPVTITAPAKINLYLHVTSRRSDGYHELDSLVTFCDLVDKITISPAADFSFSCMGPFSNSINRQDNLCIRAAKFFSERNGVNLCCDIHLEKNIPVAAGLGGGSADAAAVLRALENFYDVQVDADMTDMAHYLGADVPVCYGQSSAVMRGIGEICQNITLPDFWLVLVNPGKPCDTGAVFQGFSGEYAVILEAREHIQSISGLNQVLQDTTNQLQPSAETIVPDIKTIIEELSRQKEVLVARLSGSGATCFAVFEDRDAALSAAEKMKQKFPAYWVSVNANC